MKLQLVAFTWVQPGHPLANREPKMVDGDLQRAGVHRCVLEQNCWHQAAIYRVPSAELLNSRGKWQFLFQEETQGLAHCTASLSVFCPFSVILQITRIVLRLKIF